ncbi:MAG: tRNA (N(6)-L-threonylcarbamoyladenosine(37)-C(2))-methylthiotransferase MtaB [Eubacteriales bacterium]|nr:tRNA (N(6)-L-threonylcarbamoyladenosine(37)-C(2))-methylthiotransferase MtaB [Eubacteriales bacterium]
MHQYSAAIINLGCKVNKYEADAMRDKLVAAGIQMVEPEDIADIYIVNTCSVTNMAQKKSRQILRRAKRKNPEAIIVAAGCYVNAEHDVLKQEDFVDIVVGNNCKKDIVEVIFGYIQENYHDDYYVDINRTKEYEEMGSLQASHLDHQRAYIKIQDGCNQFCSYCIIPYTRGRVRSRRPDNILEEITKLAQNGVKEFVLTGIHISSYGVDFAKEEIEYDAIMDCKQKDANIGLGELVSMIAAIPEVQRIRLGSLEPRIVTDDFLKLITQTEKICPHFHLSLQSACNDTLKRMNRKYTIEEFEEKCELLRKYFDRPALTTDVIVGFPGETEEEFATTVENLKKIHLYEIHVFKYSVRAGTVAEKLPNQVPEEKKNSRSDVLLKLTAQQKSEYEQSLRGTVQEVLIEEPWKEHMNTEDGAAVEAELLEQLDETEEKQWYVGHTKRYIKVKVASKTNIVNEIVKVELL